MSLKYWVSQLHICTSLFFETRNKIFAYIFEPYIAITWKFQNLFNQVLLKIFFYLKPASENIETETLKRLFCSIPWRKHCWYRPTETKLWQNKKICAGSYCFEEFKNYSCGSCTVARVRVMHVFKKFWNTFFFKNVTFEAGLEQLPAVFLPAEERRFLFLIFAG